MRTLAALFLQELHRPRHVRPDPLDYLTPSVPVVPSWLPTSGTSLADDARDELLAAVSFDVRRGVATPDVRAAHTTWIEAKG